MDKRKVVAGVLVALVTCVMACADDPDAVEPEERLPLPDASAADAPFDAATDAVATSPAPATDAMAPIEPSGGNCVAGYSYCGGNKVVGDDKTLYKCNGPGAPTIVEKCAIGCIVNPSAVDDTCQPATVASPVPGYGVTYAWGVKDSAYRLGYHTGQDHAAPAGRPVVAVRNGKIRWSNDNGGDFGWWIGLDADNGRTYVYAHFSKRFAQAGDTVKAGQVIGLVGTTGFSTGPHLHFEDRPLGATTNDNTRKPAW